MTKKLNFVICLYTLILFSAGLWPFSFNPENNVSWVEGKNGICLQEGSIVYSNILSTMLYEELVNCKFLAIELIVKPKKRYSSGIRFIAANGATGKQNNFAFAQSRDNLIIFIKTTRPPDGENTYSVEISNVFSKADKKHVYIAIDDRLTSIFINGVLVKKIKFLGTFDNWDINARLLVGNDDSGQHSWEGNIYRIAIYNRDLPHEVIFSEQVPFPRMLAGIIVSYKETETGDIVEDKGGLDFKQNLYIPEYFKVLRKTILSMPDQYYAVSINFLKDVFINIIGFIPLGALIVTWFSLVKKNQKCVIWLIIALCFLISLFIELLQIFLPLRASSLMDLFNNTFGGFLGAYLTASWVRMRNGKQIIKKC